VTPVPATELARRICVAHHPHYNTVAQIPCGRHLNDARSLYGLLADDVTWAVLVRARAESYPEKVDEVIDVVEVTVDEIVDIEGAPA